MVRNSKDDEHSERKPLANCSNTHHIIDRNRDQRKEFKTSSSQMSKVPIYKTESCKIDSFEGPTMSSDPFTDNEDSHSEITAFTIKSQDEMLAANTSKITLSISPRRISTFINGRQLSTTNDEDDHSLDNTTIFHKGNNGFGGGCHLSPNEEDKLNRTYHELQNKPLTSFLKRRLLLSTDCDKIPNKKNKLSKTTIELQHKPLISSLRKSLSLSTEQVDKITNEEDELIKIHH